MNFTGHCSIELHRKEFSLAAEVDIPAKGVLGIFGHSGSGKTSLLRCIAGLENDAEGVIKYNKKEWLNSKQKICLSIQERNIGYIFQESRLFPHLSVIQNLDYGYKRRISDHVAIDRNHLFDLLNIHHLLERKPHQLSGGERQRVAIGRALLKNPDMMLLDEPLASLDERRKQEILPFLDDLHHELSIPMIYVTHSLEEASLLCDYMVVMEQGQVKYKGELHQALTAPESPLAHANNAASILEGTIIEQEPEHNISILETANGNRLQVQGLHEISKPVRIRTRAIDVSLCKDKPANSSILNVLEGTVGDIIEESESGILMQVNCQNDIVLSRISKKSCQLLNLKPGTPVYAQIKTVSIQGI